MSKRTIGKLFDRAFYLRANPDVAAARMDPLEHYMKHGAAENRQPLPLFDPAHYCSCCPEARGAGNPLLHFLQISDGRMPATHPLFDCESYLRAYPGVPNPLVDYVVNRRRSTFEGSQFGQC